MARVWKAVLQPGQYHTRGGLYDCTRAEVRRLYETGKRMLADGLLPPVPLEHQDGARPLTEAERLARTVTHNTGFVRDFRLSPDGTLSALLDVAWLPGSTDDDEIEHRLQNTIRYVSPEVCPYFVDGTGKRWGRAISHVSLTTAPVDHRQRPFGTDGAALSRAVVRLSLRNRIDPMKTTTTRKPVTRADLEKIAAASRRRRTARLSAARLSAAEPALLEEQQPLSVDQLAARCGEIREALSRLENLARLRPIEFVISGIQAAARGALERCLTDLTAALEQHGLAAGMPAPIAAQMSRPTPRPTDKQAADQMLALAGVRR